MWPQVKSSLGWIQGRLWSVNAAAELFFLEARGPAFYTPMSTRHWLCAASLRVWVQRVSNSWASQCPPGQPQHLGNGKLARCRDLGRAPPPPTMRDGYLSLSHFTPSSGRPGLTQMLRDSWAALGGCRAWGQLLKAIYGCDILRELSSLVQAQRREPDSWRDGTVGGALWWRQRLRSWSVQSKPDRSRREGRRGR